MPHSATHPGSALLRCLSGMKADYVGLQGPDRDVFGFGMDFHEQGRNLPDIYALKD